MKAAAFDYLRVTSVADACAALAAVADGAEHKIIAGGQTLVPLMAMRLARPSLLIDINDIAALQGISRADGALAIGACTRQRAVELSEEVRAAQPLLAKAVRFVGHQQTRNRGTVGGSLVHGDPSAEIPLVALTLDAELRAESAAGARAYGAGSFFEGPMVTALGADECLVEIRFPVWQADRLGTGFQEVASRQGDFAIVAAAVQLALDGDGRCARIAATVGGVAPTPVRLAALETALAGSALGQAEISGALSEIDAAIEPDSDLHATADYRRRVARVLVERAVLEAKAEAAA